MCAGLCRTYWTTFGIVEKNRNGSCPQDEWDHPPFFEFLTPPPPAPRGRWAPQGEGHVGRHCPYTTNIWCGSVQALPRYRSKCKNSPLTPIVTKISFPPFSAGRQPPNYLVPVHDVCFTMSQNFTPIAPSCVEISSTVQTNKQNKNKKANLISRQTIRCTEIIYCGLYNLWRCMAR